MVAENGVIVVKWEKIIIQSWVLVKLLRKKK
jgi:hypothetical protein